MQKAYLFFVFISLCGIIVPNIFSQTPERASGNSPPPITNPFITIANYFFVIGTNIPGNVNIRGGPSFIT